MAQQQQQPEPCPTDDEGYEQWVKNQGYETAYDPTNDWESLPVTSGERDMTTEHYTITQDETTQRWWIEGDDGLRYGPYLTLGEAETEAGWMYDE